jgi:hypothetical protein
MIFSCFPRRRIPSSVLPPMSNPTPPLTTPPDALPRDASSEHAHSLKTAAPDSASFETVSSETVDSHRFSHTLKQVSTLCGAQGLTFGELFELLRAKGHCGIILLLSLPFLIPVTIPGFSTPFGLLIIIAASCMALGLNPWLPPRLAQRRLQGEFLSKAFAASAELLRKAEGIVKPRGSWLIGNTLAYRFNGLLLVIAGFLLALPTPPGGNFPPGVAIVLLALGTLEEDAVFTVAGYLAFFLNLMLFGFIFYYGFAGAAELLGHFTA